jgi:hypothetical protein
MINHYGLKEYDCMPMVNHLNNYISGIVKEFPTVEEWDDQELQKITSPDI